MIRNTPPSWARRFLSWYCRQELLEDLEGDLNEYFQRHLKSRGARHARWIYILDVFKFMRLYTVKRPAFLNYLTQWFMIGSYIKTSTRVIVRDKLFSFINIFGLAISMSVGLLLIAFLNDIFTFDRFHEKSERIYRVIDDYQFLSQNVNHMASTSVYTGRKIRETFTGLEDVLLMRRGLYGDVKAGEKIIPLDGLYADEHFFNIFSFPMIHGNPNSALKEPNSAVITEKTALKLFGNTDVLGKTIKKDTIIYSITGVINNIPKFSHLQFDYLVSFSSMDDWEKKHPDYARWDNIWSNYTYLLLPRNANATEIQSKLDVLCEQENKLSPNSKVHLFLQPLKKISLSKDLGNQIGPTMPLDIVWVISGLVIIVLLSACFNYTNLSVARSLRRTREIGIRKVIGASRKQIFEQFLTEAVIISLLALSFSFVIFILLRTQFLSLSDFFGKLTSLEISPKLILYFIVFAIAVGTMAGLLPSLLFSRGRSIEVLKGTPSIKMLPRMTLRKVLIVLQFTFSMAFISSTLIIFKQYRQFLTFDLGFWTQNILNINLQGNNPDLVLKEFKEIPAIKSLSRSQMITSIGNYWGDYMKYKDPNDSVVVFYNTIDDNYIPLFKHKILAGKNFSHMESGDAIHQVILNQQALKRFNIGNNNPAAAIGETVSLSGTKLEIIGVVEDFHFGMVDHKIEPFIFKYTEKDLDYINAEIAPGAITDVKARIEKAWTRIDPVHPLNMKFYSEEIKDSYEQYFVMIKTIGFLAFLAIIIASLGLLGMVVFSAETRLKEITIRKLMGADILKLNYLLGRSFLVLLTISACIALPSTFYLFDKLVLGDIVYRAPIGALELLSGALLVGILSLILILSQTYRVSRANPAEVLKNE